MKEKELFIEEINNILSTNGITLSEGANRYFQALSTTADTVKPKFTKNGALVLKFMQENYETYNNIFSAKSIGEGMGISSRGASGALRKLVTDGYVNKIGETPVCYSLTDKGKAEQIEA
jgi:DNA-binding MarR family transcriptional regulator